MAGFLPNLQNESDTISSPPQTELERQCGSTDCSVVVSGRKIRSLSCVRLHCISFTASATASCREIKIEKKTFSGTDNFVLNSF